jgi:hypothetical protein
MAKTYKQLRNENREDARVMQDLMDDLPCTDEELEELIEGKKFDAGLKVIAVGLTSRLTTQTRKVLSAKTTDKKLDELAKAISIAGGISAVSIAVSGGTKGGLSKIIGLSALKK